MYGKSPLLYGRTHYFYGHVPIAICQFTKGYCSISAPPQRKNRDPVVHSERKCDSGTICYNLEGFWYLLRQWPWIPRETKRSPTSGAKLFVAVGDHLLEARRGKVCGCSSSATCSQGASTGYGFLVTPRRYLKVQLWQFISYI